MLKHLDVSNIFCNFAVSITIKKKLIIMFFTVVISVAAGVFLDRWLSKRADK